MSKVVMIKPVVAIALASLLSACVGSNAPAPVKRPVDPNANIAVRAGYESPIKGDPGRPAYDSMVDAGLAAGMAQDFGAAGLGLGVLGWLASSNNHPWKAAQLLTEVTPTNDQNALEKRISEAAFKASNKATKLDGYERATDPAVPNAVTFIKPGCQLTRTGHYDRDCSIAFIPVLLETDDPSVKNVAIYGADDEPQLTTYYGKIAAALPRDLTLYVPPRIEGKTYVPPQLVKGGKATSF